MSSNKIKPAQRQTLLQIARASIEHGLRKDKPLSIDLMQYDPELRGQQASFVTLNKNGDLRGCIGHLQAVQPLIQDVAENAFHAAFDDPRFPPLSADELDQIKIHISVLSPPEPMSFQSEDDLIQQLKPYEDGLIIEDGYYRATFLPSVWEQLPDKEDFLAHLKQKAGLGKNYWSDQLKAWRYHTESFSE